MVTLNPFLVHHKEQLCCSGPGEHKLNDFSFLLKMIVAVLWNNAPRSPKPNGVMKNGGICVGCQLAWCFWRNISLWCKEDEFYCLCGSAGDFKLDQGIIQSCSLLWNIKNLPELLLFFHVITDTSLLTTVEGAHLECVIKKHPALDSAMHLLPENVLVSGDENIPGLMSSPTGNLHQPVWGQKPKKKWNSAKIGINRIKDHRRMVEKRKLRADGQTACCAPSQILFTALSLSLFDIFWFSITTSSFWSPKHVVFFFFFFWHSENGKPYLLPSVVSVFKFQDEGLFILHATTNARV